METKSPIRVLGPVTYKVTCGRWQRPKQLHVNDLKQCFPPPGGDCTLVQDPTDLSEGNLPWIAQPSTDTLPVLDKELTLDQHTEILHLLRDFPQGFFTTPGTTSLVTYSINPPSILCFGPCPV